jgi:branched-chain amino acid aminotransferase
VPPLRHGNLSLSPAAAVLNYGQGIFEGMKAFRTVDGEAGLHKFWGDPVDP